MKPVRVEPAASADAEYAARWYEERRDGLGLEYLLELDAAIDRAAENPASYEQLYGSVRRVLMRRFPHAIYFIDEDSAVRVIAILHQHQTAERWQSRT